MAAPPGTIRLGQRENAVTFQVEGWMTMQQSLAFRRCAQDWLAEGARFIRVDLRCCTFMDSTFVGTLLSLKRATELEPSGQFFLVSPSTQCQKIIHQMGLDDVIPTTAGAEAEPSCWTELKLQVENDCAFKCNVVEAHQELASLGGRTGEIFGPVARCLAQEMDTIKKS
jgi:anti-sigma B factor antagonist